MKPSDAAVALLKEFERGPNGGFAAEPYLCPAGKETVGWGHVVQPGDRFAYPLTEKQADEILRRDLERIGAFIGFSVKVPIKQCMSDALFCLAFNIGINNFMVSTLVKMLNQCDFQGAADQFGRWNKATDPKTGKKVELAGLTRRRAAERDLFLRDGVPT